MMITPNNAASTQRTMVDARWHVVFTVQARVFTEIIDVVFVLSIIETSLSYYQEEIDNNA